VARCNIVECLKDQSSVGVLGSLGRWLAKRNRDVIGASLRFVGRVKGSASGDDV
jgi:hypothetical protein